MNRDKLTRLFAFLAMTLAGFYLLLSLWAQPDFPLPSFQVPVAVDGEPVTQPGKPIGRSTPILRLRRSWKLCRELALFWPADCRCPAIHSLYRPGGSAPGGRDRGKDLGKNPALSGFFPRGKGRSLTQGETSPIDLVRMDSLWHQRERKTGVSSAPFLFVIAGSLSIGRRSVVQIPIGLCPVAAPLGRIPHIVSAVFPGR